MKVADLFAAFEVKTNKGSINNALTSLRHLRNNLLALGSVVSAGGLIKEMIGFNSRVEDAKNGIAGMLALAKGHGTTVNSQLATAGKLYDDIRAKASELPGTTEDYVQAMQKLTLPIMSAGGNLEDLKALTVSTIVAAKAGVGGATPKTAVTDILQGIEGRYSTTDFFLKAILEPMGYAGEQGRKKFKALSKEMRFKEISKGLKNPVFTELGDIQGKSFAGQMDKAKENFAQFLGKAGKPLFDALSKGLATANEWLSKNQKKVDEIADAVGKKVVAAFEFLIDTVKFLYENWDDVKKVLEAIAILIGLRLVQNTIKWLATMSPLIAFVTVFTALRDSLGDIGAALVGLVAMGLVSKFGAVAGVVQKIATATWSWAAATRAQKVAGAGSVAGQFVNGAGGLGLGPAGRPAPGAPPAGMPAGGGKGPGMIPLAGGTAARLVKGGLWGAFFNALTPTTGYEKGEKPDSGDFSTTAMSFRDRSWGEFNLEKLYEDVQGVAKGRYYGETFGRGSTLEGFRRKKAERGNAAAGWNVEQAYANQEAGLAGSDERRNPWAAGGQLDASLNVTINGGVNMNEAQARALFEKLMTEQLRHAQSMTGGAVK